MLSSVECLADLRCRPLASVAIHSSTSCCAVDSLQSSRVKLRVFSIQTHSSQRPRCKKSLKLKLPELKCRRLCAFQGFVSVSHVANITRPESTSKSAAYRGTCNRGARKGLVTCGLMPIDPWNPSMQVDSQSIASQLFAASLLPYLGFLYHLTRSKTAPKLTLFGFYFLLVFVGATIPAGIYAKLHYGTSLSNVDWLHGGAESFLTLTNLFIVIGLRQALRKEEQPTEPSVLPDLDPEGERHPEVEAPVDVRR